MEHKIFYQLKHDLNWSANLKKQGVLNFISIAAPIATITRWIAEIASLIMAAVTAVGVLQYFTQIENFNKFYKISIYFPRGITVLK